MLSFDAERVTPDEPARPAIAALYGASTRALAWLRWVLTSGDSRLERPRDWARALGLSSGGVLVALWVGWLIQTLLVLPNIMLVFLPPVLFAAVRYGFGLALWSSLLSVVLTSLVLAPPLFEFPIPDPSVAWGLFFFVIVAAFTSSLAARIRDQTELLQRQNRRTEALFEFSTRLAALSTPEELFDTTAQYVHDILSRASIVLIPNASGELVLQARYGVRGRMESQDELAARWCWDNRQPAGRGAGTLHGATWLFVPLQTSHDRVGVLGVELEETGALLAADESKMLDALANQAATSVERARLASEVNEARLRKEGDRLRAALLTSISHDFRTPLASILGNVTSVITYGELYDPATRNEMLGIARMETERLSRFVRNLMDMTRLDAGAIGPRMELVDIGDVIGSAINGARQLLARHEVRIDLPRELPMVQLDFVLAEHVLVNLLDNAAKYSPAHSSIVVAAQRNGGFLELTVADRGPGIPEADLPSIFERFYRAHAGDSHGAGVGLGLAICKGFVSAMGGLIRAHNCPQRGGATFTVSYPIDGPCADGVALTSSGAMT